MNYEDDEFMDSTRQIIKDAKNVKDKRKRAITVIAFVAGALCLVLTCVAGYLAYKVQERQADEATSFAAQVKAACEDPEAIVPPEIDCDRAEEVVEDAPPETDTQPQPTPTDSAPVIVSDAQVELAVASFCLDTGQCRGSSPTSAQVSQAVSQYCNARGQCRGPRGQGGRPGAEGTPGAKGDTGDQGPPPSDDQVASAVAGYCSTRNDCRGPQGEQGQPGKPGDVITGGSCVFTDGTGTIEIQIDTEEGPTVFRCVGTGITPPPPDPDPDPTQGE